jgi:hypothetical protein
MIVVNGSKQMNSGTDLNDHWVARCGSSWPVPVRRPFKEVSRTGFLKVVPMWNPKFVSDEDQPFWILRPWGEPPLENMVK